MGRRGTTPIADSLAARALPVAALVLVLGACLLVASIAAGAFAAGTALVAIDTYRLATVHVTRREIGTSDACDAIARALADVHGVVLVVHTRPMHSLGVDDGQGTIADIGTFVATLVASLNDALGTPGIRPFRLLSLSRAQATSLSEDRRAASKESPTSDGRALAVISRLPVAYDAPVGGPGHVATVPASAVFTLAGNHRLTVVAAALGGVVRAPGKDATDNTSAEHASLLAQAACRMLEINAGAAIVAGDLGSSTGKAAGALGDMRRGNIAMLRPLSYTEAREEAKAILGANPVAFATPALEQYLAPIEGLPGATLLAVRFTTSDA